MTTEDFTRTAAALVAENDARVPPQRKPNHRAIEPAGTVIEIDGGMRFVSNGSVWLVCSDGAVGGDGLVTYRGITAEMMNSRYTWWILSTPNESVA